MPGPRLLATRFAPTSEPGFAVLVGILAMVLLSGCSSARAPSSPLISTSEHAGGSVMVCQQVPMPGQKADYSDREAAALGLENFRQSSPSARVVGLSLVGVHPKGSLVLRHAVLVPGGTVGTDIWGRRSLTTMSGWRGRVVVPSVAPLRRAVLDRLPRGRRFWELVVALSRHGAVGRFRGVRLTVRTSSGTTTTTTINGGGVLSRADQSC